MSNTTPAGAAMQQEQHEQLQRLLGEYQDLYLEAQRQRDALAAKVAELDAEAAFWNNHYNAAVEEQRELEMVIERLRAQPELTEAERDDLLLDADNAMRERAMQRATDAQPPSVQPDSIKDDIGLCAAAVVLAYHRKTHDHIDHDTMLAAERIEKYLGRR